MIKDKKNSIIIIVCTILIAIIGVIFVYSASRHSALNTYGDSFFYMKKQIIGVGLGIVGMFITSKLSYKIYKKFYIPFYIFGLVMLLLVFVPFLKSPHLLILIYEHVLYFY